MIREPGICVFSFRIFVRCLLQMEEQRPARMPVHSDMLGHAICMCLALYCSPLGHSLFLLRDIVVTHTTVRSAVRPRVAPHAHTASGPVCAKRNAQRVPRQLGVAMGAGAAMRRGPALILTISEANIGDGDAWIARAQIAWKWRTALRTPHRFRESVVYWYLIQ
jgi:hypothetical protein